MDTYDLHCMFSPMLPNASIRCSKYNVEEICGVEQAERYPSLATRQEHSAASLLKLVGVDAEVT